MISSRVVALACLSLLAEPAIAQDPCPAGTLQLIIYHAGSHSPAFKAVEKVFTEQTGVCVVEPLATQWTGNGRAMEQESGDGRFDCLDPDNFRYRITAREITGA